MVLHRVLILTPACDRSGAITGAVQVDLDRLARPGVVLTHRCTGAGPPDVRSGADALAATPHVIAAIRAATADGCDAVIVDCTADPGVLEARREVTIPVVGPGAALGDAARRSRPPVVELTGDELRQHSFDELTALVADAPTIAIGGTGHSSTAQRLALLPHHPTVLEPLELALEECIRILTRHAHDSRPDD